MPWRYQPVYRDDPGGRSVMLCECYLDGDGGLLSWTEPTIAPLGENLDELRADLRRMLADAMRWIPVAYDTLWVGMTFEEAAVPVEWRPTSEAPEKPGTYINVRTATSYRWLAYKPEGARQMGRPGRWQRATEHGWENARLPIEGAEFVPTPEGRSVDGE